MKLSIIIPNYNYGCYVGKAIETALAVDWPDVEVIVVDDGSTDNSETVIRSFGDKIHAIFQSNATQRVACNVGYAASTGEAILFLDSDDMVDPAIAREVAKVWRPGLSKVQYQMTRVDKDGRLMHAVFPAYQPMPTPALIRDWVSATAAYPTPPGSGNVYARSFLDQIFPIDDSCGAAADSACLATAPFFGDIETIVKPLVCYRTHDRNDSALMGDPTRFVREILRAKARCEYARRQIGMPVHSCELLIMKSLEILQFRVAARRLVPHLRPLSADSFFRLLVDCLRVPCFFPASTRSKRCIVAVWAILGLISPQPLANKLIAKRFGG